MPKYGWFKTSGAHPNVEYEGDYMQMEKEYVKIFKYSDDAGGTGRLFAAIRLDKGEDVREIS